MVDHSVGKICLSGNLDDSSTDLYIVTSGKVEFVLRIFTLFYCHCCTFMKGLCTNVVLKPVGKYILTYGDYVCLRKSRSRTRMVVKG